MKTIILCADDYGQNTAISQAILELFEKKRLSATSCMTNYPDWAAHAKALAPYKDTHQIGLHLNLTDGPPFISKLGQYLFPGLGTWIKRAYTHRLKLDLIEAEFNAQLDAFIEAMGKMPDFIDGHQHIHQFPGIREILIGLYQKRLMNTSTYVRSVYLPHALWRKQSGYIKNLIIQLLGAKALKNLLIQNNISHNTSFSGFYDFADAAQYATLFPLFLKEVREGGIIMCHPGNFQENQLVKTGYAQDPISKARYTEYLYFLSDEFSEACEDAGVTINSQKVL